jgi:hypothetical protein
VGARGGRSSSVRRGPPRRSRRPATRRFTPSSGGKGTPSCPSGQSPSGRAPAGASPRVGRSRSAPSSG